MTVPRLCLLEDDGRILMDAEIDRKHIETMARLLRGRLPFLRAVADEYQRMRRELEQIAGAAERVAPRKRGRR